MYLRRGTNKNRLDVVLLKDLKGHKYIYLMLLPVVAYYVVFCYMPMYGMIIAFQDFNLFKGVFGSPMASHWGMDNFIRFFSSPYFPRVIFNTFTINLLSLIFGFPAPVILALLINEMRNRFFKRVFQTISFLPFFISLVVVAGIIRDFTSNEGVIAYIAQSFFQLGDNVNLLAKSAFYRPVYIISDVWQYIGFNSLIYMSAISSISPELYETAFIDGASRLKRLWHVTLPGIAPTMIILMILQLGRLMDINLEKVLLLYSPSVYNVADVISSYVYRMGLVMADFGYSAAAGVFNSVLNFLILILVNAASNKFTKISLF